MRTVSIRAFLLQSPGQRRRARLAVLAALALCWAAFPAASVAGPTVLYSFSAPSSPKASPVTNSDGQAPASRLVLGGDGWLYGTTRHGGANGAGSIFRIMTNATGFSNLYSFQASFQAVTNNSGETNYETNYNLEPNDLAQGTDGSFYGTTRSGGSNFTGTIFAISPSGSFTNLHTFAGTAISTKGHATSAEGAAPAGALAQGADGNFYGTTQYGGANGTGTIFRVSPTGVFTNLYSFSALVDGSGSAKGAVPNALVLANDGAFYGATQQGGQDNAGTFFKFTTTGGLTQIYSFNGGAPGNNPVTPNSALAQGTNGNFYGTSAFGGAQGGGCIFEITAAGGMTVLHSFPQLNAGAGAALAPGTDGNFYGTTAANGLNGEGAVFKITPSGDFGACFFSPLNTNSDNAGGANPSAALTAGTAGILYGTCAAGGANGSGVIFQFVGADFNPPSFLSVTNPPPALTNTLVGASVTLARPAQGFAPLSYQWLKNGSNFLANGGDLSGCLTNTLTINPVFPRDVGSYSLVISNTWGALTSSVTVLTVTRPQIFISSPAPGARTHLPVFAGTATNAPLFAGADPNEIRLTNIIYSISNLLSGSTLTGLVAAITTGAGGTSNWSLPVTPLPGSNILSVQCVDASGNVSAAASRSFFYEAAAPLTVLTTGSGAGAFTITNGAMLNIGQGYAITANPVSSVFNNWVAEGIGAAGAYTNYDRTLSFIMQSNIILTANFMARELPAVSISSPTAHERIGSPDFKGTAASSPLLAGANPNYVRLTNVEYWLTNAATGSVSGGFAALTNGGSVSNWSIPVTPLPGTNTLAVQSQDFSGGLSRIESRTFFYKAPAQFTLLKTGNGTGTFKAAASVAGDAPPTNGAMLNIGESYTITAKPGPFSRFIQWQGISGNPTNPSVSFIMTANLVLTATFADIPPVVAISTPKANSRYSGPAFQASGAASGNFPITNVTWTLANSFTGALSYGSATLTAGASAASNWSIAFVPPPGPNVLTVYCVDVNNNQSAPVSRPFFYEVLSRLSVANAGPGRGTFKGAASVAGDTVPADGAMLYLGESYKITAVPDSTSLFSNWVSAQGVAFTPVLPFVMQSNLVLTVTFVTNFFPAAPQTFNGLFFPPDAVSVGTSGMLYNLVLRKTGAFSGKLLLAGTNYPFSTNFNASGQAGFYAGPFWVSLALDSETPQITGTVSGSPLTANLASNILPSAEYTALFSPAAGDSAGSPPGDGYALITNDAGSVTLSGALADGTRYSQNVPASRAGALPVFASLYTSNASAGLLLGWINLTNLQAAPPPGALAWIKQPLKSPARYTNGFAGALSVQGALWTNPSARTSAISLTNGELVLSNTGLLLTFTNIVLSNNTLENPATLPAKSLSGSINPKTGLLTFTNSSGKTTLDAVGAILQDTTNAGGFFLTPTNSGAFWLQP
jgi:uncharacterized repeat protein (TIGR03803 family)